MKDYIKEVLSNLGYTESQLKNPSVMRYIDDVSVKTEFALGGFLPVYGASSLADLDSVVNDDNRADIENDIQENLFEYLEDFSFGSVIKRYYQGGGDTYPKGSVENYFETILRNVGYDDNQLSHEAVKDWINTISQNVLNSVNENLRGSPTGIKSLEDFSNLISRKDPRVSAVAPMVNDVFNTSIYDNLVSSNLDFNYLVGNYKKRSSNLKQDMVNNPISMTAEPMGRDNAIQPFFNTEQLREQKNSNVMTPGTVGKSVVNSFIKGLGDGAVGALELLSQMEKFAFSGTPVSEGDSPFNAFKEYIIDKEEQYLPSGEAPGFDEAARLAGNIALPAVTSKMGKTGKAIGKAVDILDEATNPLIGIKAGAIAINDLVKLPDADAINLAKQSLNKLYQNVDAEPGTMDFAKKFVKQYGTEDVKATITIFEELEKKNPSLKNWMESSNFYFLEGYMGGVESPVTLMNVPRVSHYLPMSKGVLNNPIAYLKEPHFQNMDLGQVAATMTAHEMTHSLTTELYRLGRSGSFESKNFPNLINEKDVSKAKELVGFIDNIANDMAVRLLAKHKGLSPKEMEEALFKPSSEGFRNSVNPKVNGKTAAYWDNLYAELKGMGTETQDGLLAYKFMGFANNSRELTSSNKMNADEFTAYLLTDEQFKKYASEIPYEGKSNFYSKIKEYFQKLLSLVGLGEGKTIGNEAASKLINSLQTFNFEVLDNSIKANQKAGGLGRIYPEEFNLHAKDLPVYGSPQSKVKVDENVVLNNYTTQLQSFIEDIETNVGSRLNFKPGSMAYIRYDENIKLAKKELEEVLKKVSSDKLIEKLPKEIIDYLEDMDIKFALGGNIEGDKQKGQEVYNPYSLFKNYEDFMVYNGPGHEGGGIRTNREGFAGNDIEVEGEEPLVYFGERKYAFSKRLIIE